jgi:hypothetical protein
MNDNLKLCQRLISECCTDEDRRALVDNAVQELNKLGYKVIDLSNGNEARQSHVAAVIRKQIFGV